MKSRTIEYNASASSTPLIKYAIEIKIKNKWKPYKVRGLPTSFDNKWHANNYGLRMNKFHTTL